MEINGNAYRQESDSMILFRFAQKRKMFFMDYKSNRPNIEAATDLLKQNMGAIRHGQLLISVNGYCSTFDSERQNLRMAKNRSNQVKSYFITHLGLKEEHYKTTNHPYAFQGDRNIVAMMELIQVPSTPSDTAISTQEIQPEPQPVVTSQPMPADTARVEMAQPTVTPSDDEGNRWNIKTNLPAWIPVVPNVAVEYRFGQHWSVDLPVMYSPFTVARNYRFRIFSVQPSVRYWFGQALKGHFIGIHATAGQYNVSVDKRYRYQDRNGMWGGGIDYGYALPLSHRWGLEFNIGAGVIYSDYNTYYNIHNGAVRSSDSKTYWGITRFGISLIYKLK